MKMRFEWIASNEFVGAGRWGVLMYIKFSQRSNKLNSNNYHRPRSKIRPKNGFFCCAPF